MYEVPAPRWVIRGYSLRSRDRQEILSREPEAEKGLDYGREHY